MNNLCTPVQNADDLVKRTKKKILLDRLYPDYTYIHDEKTTNSIQCGLSAIFIFRITNLNCHAI